MAEYDFDLLTLGAGSGGIRASRVAAAYGARVAIAEERYLGGTCVNVGCIPKKLLVYASEFGEAFDDAAGFGWSIGKSSFDWTKLITNKDREITRLNGVYRRLLADSGVKLIQGNATLIDSHTVTIAGKRYTARYLLIATGSWPSVPPVSGAKYAITSNEAFFLPRLPRRVILVGGGYIAVEFAGIFRGLGARVHLCHRGPLFLRGFDNDIRQVLAGAMEKRGVELRFNTTVEKIEQHGTELFATFNDGSIVDADAIIYATGRAPNTRALWLANAGVRVDKDGAVVVDEFLQSSVPHIYAVGDCINRVKLTPVALAEGRSVAETLFNNNPTKVDYENIPSAVFSQPNIGTVGLTEEEARKIYSNIDVYTSRFRPLKHTLSGRDETTFMKLIVERSTRRVHGCHMVGHDAGEIIQGLAVAMKCNATKEQFDSTIGIHPTTAEEFVTMRDKS